MQNLEHDSIREQVRNRYAAIAEKDDAAGCGCSEKKGGSCCGASEEAQSYSAKLGYSKDELKAVPEGANLGLGCGNPLAIASIKKGETVLDLGSGAGFDCFLAVRQLEGTGKVIGVDMTPAMITKARRNAARSGYANVEFRLGEIEALPVADATVDIIISNCVINLSPEKAQVFREAFRVLKSGGRLSVSDVVARRPIPEEWRKDADQLAACISGAEVKDRLEEWLAAAGFVDIRITPKDGSSEIIDTWSEAKKLGDYLVSAIIQARKP